MVGSLKKITNLIFVSMLIISNVACAEEDKKDINNFTPTNSQNANWAFVGTVEDEIGQTYSYFFRLERAFQKLKLKVALFDNQSKKIVFQEDGEQLIENQSDFKWLVGHAFLRYYKVSNSWVFGLKMPNKQGFNFKVSMFNKPENPPVTRYLKNGISFIVTQSGHLNGHINLGNNSKDQFVTSKNTWVMQTWFKDNFPPESQNLSSLLCGFNDGRGLYSIKSLNTTRYKNVINGLFDEEGNSIRVSRFIRIEKINENSWNISVPNPKMNLHLSEVYKLDDVSAGYLTNDVLNGFCLLSRKESN